MHESSLFISKSRDLSGDEGRDDDWVPATPAVKANEELTLKVFASPGQQTSLWKISYVPANGLIFGLDG